MTVVYTSTGKVLFTTSETGLGTVSSLETEVPNGYYVDKVENGKAVLVAIPLSEDEQKLADLEAKQAEDDERYIDQEYRLTLLELGVAEA